MSWTAVPVSRRGCFHKYLNYHTQREQPGTTTCRLYINRIRVEIVPATHSVAPDRYATAPTVQSKPTCLSAMVLAHTLIVRVTYWYFYTTRPFIASIHSMGEFKDTLLKLIKILI